MPLFVNDTPFSPEDFLNKLIPNFWSLLINLLALIVFFIVLYFIAYKPLRKLVDERRKKMEEEKNHAHELEKIAQNRELETRGIVEEAKVVASTLRQQGEEEGLRLKEEILLSAEEDLKKKTAEAEEELKQKELAMRASLKEDTVHLALQMAEKLVDQKMNEDLDAKLLDSFQNELEGEKNE